MYVHLYIKYLCSRWGNHGGRHVLVAGYHLDWHRLLLRNDRLLRLLDQHGLGARLGRLLHGHGHGGCVHGTLGWHLGGEREGGRREKGREGGERRGGREEGREEREGEGGRGREEREGEGGRREKGREGGERRGGREEREGEGGREERKMLKGHYHDILTAKIFICLS